MLQANWYRASQFCRYHDMHLASFSSESEYIAVLNLINAFGTKMINQLTDIHTHTYHLILTGFSEKRFWTSGNDFASTSDYFWMANGQPLTFTSWLPGEPNRIGVERCIEMWNGNIIGNPLKWNNSLCDQENYFVCERHF